MQKALTFATSNYSSIHQCIGEVVGMATLSGISPKR